MCSSSGLLILHSIIYAHGEWLMLMISWEVSSLWDTDTSHAPHSQKLARVEASWVSAGVGKRPFPLFLISYVFVVLPYTVQWLFWFFFLLTDKSVRKWTRSWISVTVPTLYLKFPFPSENDYFNMRSSFSYEFTPYDIFRSKVRQTSEESSPVPQACLLQICYSQQQWILISVTYITSKTDIFQV